MSGLQSGSKIERGQRPNRRPLRESRRLDGYGRICAGPKSQVFSGPSLARFYVAFFCNTPANRNPNG